jgi:dTDP-4-dehydrorhamnose reductase
MSRGEAPLTSSVTGLLPPAGGGATLRKSHKPTRTAPVSAQGSAAMRAIVIGTSGQLATELRRRSCPAGIELLPALKVDVTDAAGLTRTLDELRPELMLNASAYTAVDRAESEPDRAFAVNATGPKTMAEWCARHGAALVHVSTDYVFDGSKRSAYVETDATAPLGVYGESKLAGEEAVRSGCAQHVTLRTSWVFSAHGQNFLKTMLRLAAERDELRVVADQQGRPTAANDLADAMLLVASRIRAGAPSFGTYHFAGSGETTWHGFAQAHVDEQAPITGKKPRVTPITTQAYPTPAKRPANSVLATAAFEHAFGVVPRHWRDGVREAFSELTRPS